LRVGIHRDGQRVPVVGLVDLDAQDAVSDTGEDRMRAASVPSR
jgi:hypothetical protein